MLFPGPIVKTPEDEVDMTNMIYIPRNKPTDILDIPSTNANRRGSYINLGFLCSQTPQETFEHSAPLNERPRGGIIDTEEEVKSTEEPEVPEKKVINRMPIAN